MTINELLPKLRLEGKAGLNREVICKDGFKMSVQASSSHYCSPREDNAEFYWSFEMGFPTQEEELLLPYAEDPDQPTQTVYGWVLADIIDRVIAKHGGPK